MKTLWPTDGEFIDSAYLLLLVAVRILAASDGLTRRRPPSGRLHQRGQYEDPIVGISVKAFNAHEEEICTRKFIDTT